MDEAIDGGHRSGLVGEHLVPFSEGLVRRDRKRAPFVARRDEFEEDAGHRDASSPAVYASRRALPHAMQDSLPAGGLRLCRAGVEPAGAHRKVSDQLILLPRTSPGARSILKADPAYP